MELSQIEWEAIEKAAHEAQVEAAAMAEILLLDPGATEALESLRERGLMELCDGDIYLLTEAGESLHRDREARLSAAVKRRTPTW